MDKKFRKKEIYELLKEKSISYEVIEHMPVYTMEDMDNAGITKKGNVCKNLFLRDVKGKNHFLVTVPEHRKINLGQLAKQLQSTSFSFASPQRLEKYLGVEQGCVSPFGLMNDDEKNVTLVMDMELLGLDSIGVHPNDNTATVWLSCSDLCELIKEQGNKIIFISFCSKGEACYKC